MQIIRSVTVDEWRRLGAGLFVEHYDEIARKKHIRVLDPDWVTYGNLEAAGRLIALAAFDGEAMVGYSVSIDVPSHLHYRGVHYVQNDVIFVAESHRATGVGGRLMAATKSHARSLGAIEMLWHAKKLSALDLALSQSKTAELVDLIYSQEL